MTLPGGAVATATCKGTARNLHIGSRSPAASIYGTCNETGLGQGDFL
jgi:hypothetical protein